MSKDMKFGVVLVLVFAAVFAGVLYKRVTKPKQSIAQGAKNNNKSSSSMSPTSQKDPFRASRDSSNEPTVETAVGSRYANRYQASSNEVATLPAETTPEPTAPPTSIAQTDPPQASFLPQDQDSITSDEPVSPATEPAKDSAKPAEAVKVEEMPDAKPAAPQRNPFSRPSELASELAESKPNPNQPSFKRDEPPNNAKESLPSTDIAASSVPTKPASRPAVDEDSGPIAEPESSTEVHASNTEHQPRRPFGRYIGNAEEPATPADDGSRSTPKDYSEALQSGKYTVKPNDNYSSIAERIYGNSRYFKALHAANSQQHPIADDLAVGDEIAIPTVEELERQFPKLCPKHGRAPKRDPATMPASATRRANMRTYVVQEGDTLFDIARYELGKASRWAEVFELNRDILGDDFDYLQPGVKIALPADDGEDAVTRQPDDSLQR